jgi:hypothetical protein
MDSAGRPAPEAPDVARLRAELAALQDARVDEWLRLVRFGGVIPLNVERSLSWRLTRPVRLAETAVGVLRRDGSARFWSAVRVRLGRLVRRR